MLKAVILESYAINENDINWSCVKNLVDELVVYGRTPKDKVIERLQGAQIAIVNKVNINEEVLNACKDLKWIGITATGYDTLDIVACKNHNIPVANVPGYSTNSVAQMAFALILELCHSAGRYDKSVRAGHWQIDIPESAQIIKHQELFGKTIGLIGFGNIAKQVATIANAFGMRVICHTRTLRSEYENLSVEFLPLETLLSESDIISLHCPATESTKNMINEKTLSLCKEGVRIINTSRGALIDEPALIKALKAGKVSAFAADVVSKEPICEQNELLNMPNVILTPHIAWATPEALDRLANIVADNLKSYLSGNGQNVVNGV